MLSFGYNWGMALQSVRKKYNKLFVINDKLRKIAFEMISSQPKMNSPKDGIVGHMMAKGYKTHGVILNLCRNGYGEDAQMLSRTLFDAYLIEGNVIEDETDATAWQYLNFDDITRLKMFEYIKDKEIYQKELESRKNHPKPKQEDIETIELRKTQWLEEYGKDFKYRWHVGKTTGDLAEALEMKPYFETAYNLQSQLVHSLPRTGDYYLRDDGQRLWLNVEPGEQAVDLALISSFNVFIGIVLGFNQHFNLGYEERVRALIPELSVAVDSL